MELEEGLFTDIVILFAAAFLGGLTVRILRMPVLIGYMAGGMVIGPHVLALVSDVETVRTLAEFGVILLLFGVGVQVSFQDLLRLGRVVMLVGLGQLAGSIAVGFWVGTLLGWTSAQSVVLGLVISMSSTMVVLKTLSDRGELHTLHGRLLTGLLVLQDIAFIGMVAVLPAMDGEGSEVLSELGFGLLKAAGVLAAMVVLGGRLLPWLLRRAALLGSREVFVITVVAIAFGTAAITQAVGLSAALGAFVAGLVLSESYGQRALAEVVPLRDTFAALFFVSLGMLTDPNYLVENAALVLLVVALVIGVKLLLTSVLLRLGGFLPHTALLTGIGMVQVGEFSFILASSATVLGVVDEDFLPLVVLAAVITMALTPWAMLGGDRAVQRLSRHLRLFRPYLPGEERAERAGDRTPRLRNHVVLAGMGRVGALVAGALSDQHIPFIGIDMDPRVVARFRREGRHAIHGDSSNATVLDAARISHASLLVVTSGDVVGTHLTVEHAQQANQKLDIVVRVRWREEGERLLRLGVAEVVWPEMEAGLEIMRHSLVRSGCSIDEVEALVGQLRQDLAFGTDEDDVIEVSGA